MIGALYAAVDRTALPIAGDNDGAKADAVALIDRLGLDAVDVGSLTDGWASNGIGRLYPPLPRRPDHSWREMMHAPAVQRCPPAPCASEDVIRALPYDEAHDAIAGIAGRERGRPHRSGHVRQN
jgi:8-hydroxy-5-deazaflavin:NADPH oxidoreductase